MKRFLACILVVCALLQLVSCIRLTGEEAYAVYQALDDIDEAIVGSLIDRGYIANRDSVQTYRDISQIYNRCEYEAVIDCGAYWLSLFIEYNGYNRGYNAKFFLYTEILYKSTDALPAEPTDFQEYNDLYDFYNDFWGTDVDFASYLSEYYKYELLVENFHENKSLWNGVSGKYTVNYSVTTPDPNVDIFAPSVKLSYGINSSIETEEDGSVTETYTTFFTFGLIYSDTPAFRSQLRERYPDFPEE